MGMEEISAWSPNDKGDAFKSARAVGWKGKGFSLRWK